MKDAIKLSKSEIIGICEFLKIHHFENAYLLLDYITNLQNEVRINNDLIPYLKNKEKSLKKQITNLQKENKTLKEELLKNK